MNTDTKHRLPWRLKVISAKRVKWTLLLSTNSWKARSIILQKIQHSESTNLTHQPLRCTMRFSD